MQDLRAASLEPWDRRRSQEFSVSGWLGLWTNPLDVDRIGVHDDCFALGGHSLLLAELGRRLEESFGVAVPLQFFVEAAPVEAMSSALVDALIAAADEESDDHTDLGAGTVPAPENHGGLGADQDRSRT